MILSTDGQGETSLPPSTSLSGWYNEACHPGSHYWDNCPGGIYLTHWSLRYLDAILKCNSKFCFTDWNLHVIL